MKTIIKLIFLMVILNTGCSAQKNLLENNINSNGNKQPLEDSVLLKLQSENDLIIAYTIENFAWAKSIHYKIIAQHNGEWNGYDYRKSMLPNNNNNSPTAITTVSIDNSSCDSLLNFITTQKAWTIRGDEGDNYCSNGKICNIYDAAGARLWFISKSAYINPSYYAPQFFEKCCPEKQRGLFVSITDKIAAIVGDTEE